MVLTDIIMPEQEGMETIGEMRKLNKTVRIVAMSGGGIKDLDVLLLARRLGADATLAKPFRKDDLLACVEGGRPGRPSRGRQAPALQSFTTRFAVATAVLVVASLEALSVLAITVGRHSVRGQIQSGNTTSAGLAARAFEQYVLGSVRIVEEASQRPKLSQEIRPPTGLKRRGCSRTSRSISTASRTSSSRMRAA